MEARRLNALDHGYVDMNGHYVPLQDHGHQHTRKPIKALPRESLPSSTYMVCTQAGNSALVPLPNFVARLEHLETQVSTLQQKIMDIDAMRDAINKMGHQLTQFQNILQFQHDQIQPRFQHDQIEPRKVFQMRRADDLQDDSSEGLNEYYKALAHSKRNNYTILPP